MSDYNNLTISVFAPYSLTPRVDPVGSLRASSVMSIDNFFPGGLYGSATIFIPQDVTYPLFTRGGDRVVIRNGVEIVWEGEISGIGYGVGGGAVQGITLDCTGPWGALLGKTTINRRYIDTRISANAWAVDTSAAATGLELATIDRLNRLRITPKAEAWLTTDIHALEYIAPTGETVARVVMTSELAESAGANDWICRLKSSDDSARTNENTEWSETTTNSTAQDVDLGTPRQYLHFELVPADNQTPTADGTYFGEMSGVKTYYFASATTTQLDEIVKDLRAAVSNLNSDETNIDTPGSALELDPFITEGQEAISSILSRAAMFGDTAFAEWYVRLIDSEKASTPDGKPVLESKQYPILTDYDYAVRLEDENLIPPLDIVRDFDGIRNWITVIYRDVDDGRDVITTPDDDANLTDATSVTAWGRRDLVISIPTANSTTAVNIGRKILAAQKDPKFYISGPIVVSGFIRGKNGNPIPSSQIEAGKRVRIENFLDDLVGTSGAGLTFIISETRYTDPDETCRIYTGVPDDLAVMLAQQKFSFI